jgi:polyisoprenoid-binding protein YceI
LTVNRIFVIGVAALVLVVTASTFTWLWVAGGSGEPSSPLSVPEASPSPSGARAFVIDPARSLVSFVIEEELRGSPNQVFGETDQVAGQVLLDPSDLASVQFSAIVVNARTLRTDSARRDRAIRGPIALDSADDRFEFITFNPMAVEGLEGAAEVGDTLDFTVIGDLTVRGETRAVTFQVQATLVDEVTLQGSASARVSRSDFGIGIPRVLGVANVADEVMIFLDFVAVSG